MMEIRGWSLIAGMLLIGALIGCRQIDQTPRQTQLFASASPETTPPEGVVIADIVGQAVCKDSASPDDRLRAAAILDALRKLALGKRSELLTSASDDTIIASAEWDGIRVLGVTIRHGGVVLLDSVVVTIANFQNEKIKVHRWKSFNMELAEPADADSPQLSELIGALKAREIETTGGRPVARGLWQESLSVRRWKRK